MNELGFSAKLMVGVYLRGDDLDPEAVSAQLRLQPSRSQSRGQVRASFSERKYVANVGLWALVKESDTNEPTEQIATSIQDLLCAFPESVRLNELRGVEDAYADIFVAVNADEDGGGTIEVSVGYEQIEKLGVLGLALRLTATVVRP